MTEIPVRRTVLLLSLLLTCVMFALDVWVQNFAFWEPYLLALVAVYRWGRRRDVLLLAGWCTALIGLSYWLDPAQGVVVWAVANHLGQIAVLWFVAWLLTERARMEEHLLRYQGELEEQVQARTADLQREVEERRQAQVAVQESEGRYRLLSNNAREVIWAIDLAGNVTYVSPSVTPVLGYTHAEAVARLWCEGLGEQGAQSSNSLAAALAALRAGEAIDSGPHIMPLLRSDGTVLWTEVVLAPVYDPEGRPLGLSGSIRDIVRRREAELALRRSEERFAKLFHANPAGSVLVRREGQVIEVNEAYARMTGYTRDELVGATSVGLGLMTPAQRAEILANMAASGSVRGMDIELRRKDGELVHVLFTGEAVEVNGEACLLISTIDIGRRKRMEVALRRINEELEERVAQRTAALAAALADVQRAGKMKDEFMAMVSHELRTPLTGVLTMAEVLETQHAGSLTERQLRYVQAIRTSGERLHALVNSILSYTDLVAGNVVLTPGPCRLAQLCAEAAAGVRARAEAKQQTVDVHVAPPDLGIETDAGALRQVINRLLANAVKFTPEGGQIGIEARVGRTGAREGAWGPGAEGAGAPHVEIVVWDTGIGLQSELLPEVVKPFVQADAALARSHEGVGMGLAYVHQMLLLMGGTLALESAPHAGSRFIVSLPQRMAVQPAAHTVDAVPA